MGLQGHISTPHLCPWKGWIHKDFLKTVLMMVLEDSQQWKSGFQSKDMRWLVYSQNVTHFIEYHVIWALDIKVLLILELSSVPWAALWRSKIWSKDEQISLKVTQYLYIIFIFLKYPNLCLLEWFSWWYNLRGRQWYKIFIILNIHWNQSL